MQKEVDMHTKGSMPLNYRRRGIVKKVYACDCQRSGFIHRDMLAHMSHGSVNHLRVTQIDSYMTDVE